MNDASHQTKQRPLRYRQSELASQIGTVGITTLQSPAPKGLANSGQTHGFQVSSIPFRMPVNSLSRERFAKRPYSPQPN